MLVLTSAALGCNSIDLSVSPEAEDAGDTDTDGADASPDPDVSTDPDTVDVTDEGETADAPPVDAADLPIDLTTDQGRDPHSETDPDAPDAEPDLIEDADADLPDAAGPWFELGIGEDESIAVIPFQDAAMAQGIQGGFHVWGGFRGGGFDPIQASFEATLTTDDEERVGAVYLLRDVETNDEGILEAAGITVFLVPSVIPELEEGSVWEYCGTLLSADGFTDTQCVPITARCCEYLDL